MEKRKINNKVNSKSASGNAKRNSITAIFGSTIILFGVALISYNYIQSKKMIAYDYMANVFYTDNQENKEEVKEQQDNNGVNIEETNKKQENDNQTGNAQNDNQQNNSQQNNNQQSGNQNVNNNSFQYIGFLEIPKINLKKGFVDKSSKDNDVEKNLYVAPNSNYPDVEKGNFIIAAHSGTGWKAFFNNLYKLSKGDQAVVSYNNKKYTYSIVNIYKQNKTGKIAIYRNYDKTTLTLVTCTNDDDKTQTVYIAELVSVS